MFKAVKGGSQLCRPALSSSKYRSSASGFPLCPYSVAHKSAGPFKQYFRYQHTEGPTLHYDHQTAWDRRSERKEKEVRRYQDRYSTLSTEALEKKLEAETEHRPNILKVVALIQSLYHNRRSTPKAWHFNSVISAQADAKYGSYEALDKILQEMEKERFESGFAHLHDILRVLAIHPNYVLRSEIIEMVRAKSFALSPAGWHDLATALIRERQLELAVETLEHMKIQKIEIQPWLRRLCIYSFCDAGEFQAAVEISDTILGSGEGSTMNVWTYLLDTASTAYHHEAVSHVWNKIVATERFNPATGTCLNVLTTAARAGDTRLATSVFEILSQRNDALTLIEYEALIDTYLNAHDPESALRILCTISRFNIEPNDGMTRSLVSFLRSNAEYPPSAAWGFLGTMSRGSSPPKMVTAPIAVLNAIMEAHLDLAEPHAAQEVYRDRISICPSAPNLRTFHLLSRACFAVRDVSQVQKIHNTMPDFDLRADALLYELSILTAAAAKDFRAAYKYMAELKEIGGDLEEYARKTVAELLAGEKDSWATGLKVELVQSEGFY